MLAGTCTTIANLLTSVYGLSVFQSNLTNFVFYIMYIPSNFMAIAILTRWGLKSSIVVGTMFLLVGAWIRMFIMFSGNFTPYFVGAIIAAIGQPFLMNIPSKIASTWFGDKERAIATAVGSMSVPIGTVLSFVLPQTVISEDDFNNPAEGKQHFGLYIMIQTFIVTMFCIPALTFIKEEPPSPPSVVANDTNNNMGFSRGIKELVSNRNYILLFLCYMFIYGIQASMGAIYANLAAKYGYSLTSNSLSCLLFLVGGILNSFFLGTLLDKYQNYRRLIQIISGLSVVTTALHFGTLPLNNPILESTAMLLIGISVIPISSVAFTFSVELAFPVPEALTNGMMITVSLVWGTATGFLCSSLSESSPQYALAFWTGSALLSLFISFFV